MNRGRRSEAGPGHPRRRVVGVTALVLLVGLLGWVGYQYFLTNVIAGAAYRQQVDGLRASWQTSASPGSDPTPAAGRPMGVLRVPAFGDDYEVPILSGTEPDLLSRGVGHYPGTAAPGQLGNCALTGLRVTSGQPFARLHELDQGQQVIIETGQSIFTYVIDVAPRDLTVSADDSWVLLPTPGQPDAKPTSALLTLITAQDVLPTSDRTVGFAHLASTQNKS